MLKRARSGSLDQRPPVAVGSVAGAGASAGDRLEHVVAATARVQGSVTPLESDIASRYHSSKSMWKHLTIIKLDISRALQQFQSNLSICLICSSTTRL